MIACLLVFILVKASGGKAPPPVSCPSVFADEDHEIEQAVAFIEPSQRDQTKLKQQSLRRDGYQCIYTGLFDRRSVKEKKVTLPQEAGFGHTECAHIIPFALGKFNDKDTLETENKALIWWTLYRYFPALRGKIDAVSINQLGNVVTLFSEAHNIFGEFELAFWPQENAPVCLHYFFALSIFNIRKSLTLSLRTRIRQS